MATTTEPKAGRMHNPAHPGQVLRELYMEPMGVTAGEVADALGYSRKHVSHLVNGRVSITPDMAARLAIAFSTDPDIWINLQAQYDIWTLSQQPKPKVRPLRAA
jgi:addiction module HigA family antidote